MSAQNFQPYSRREVLSRACNGLGALALAHMISGETSAAAEINPLAAKPQHLPRKAKHCIFLFGSSEKSVGEWRLGQLAKCMI